MGRLEIDSLKGKRIAESLHAAFATTGIHGHTEMPEDALPEGMKRGSLQHLLFITLTVSIDYQRDANTLWAVSGRAYEDPELRYLFDPEALHLTRPKQITMDMQRYGLAKKPTQDAHIWRTVGVTFCKKWEGNPVHFLGSCNWDCLEILRRLQTDTHVYNGKEVHDYPFLRGPKIGPLWLRMLRDNVGIEGLQRLDEVPIPVDIHIARATLATGVVRGCFSGGLPDVFEVIRKAWFESVRGLSVGNRRMVALDLDEPLWHLSKYGCTRREKETGRCPRKTDCEAKSFCAPGRMSIEKNRVEIDT